MNIYGGRFCYRFYGENNPNLDNWDHGFDLGFIELLVIRVISDCLLIPVLYWLFVDQEQAEWIRKGKDQVS